MAKTEYRNYQLYRTLPKLSGNMQLDLILDVKHATGHVKQAHIRPISKYVNYVPVVDERIMDRPHHLNIKRFYERTRSGFYEQTFEPRLNSDWPMMISVAEMQDLKYIKEFDDTYFAGCQRMAHKLYGCTHEILVPVWLDHCYGLRFNLYVTNAQPMFSGIRPRISPYKITIDVSKEYLAKVNDGYKFHHDFTKYLMDYFDYVNITSGSNNVMSVNFKQNMSTISGLLVESGNYTIRQNLNLAKNLLFRERPLLEANSLITNTFMDYKMIATQLINFNLCFNFNELVDSMVIPADGIFERSNIWVEVEYIKALRDDKNIVYFDDPDFEAGTGYKWETLPIADFYTNHHYIPKQVAKTAISGGVTDSYNDLEYPRNALDYKMDFSCTDLIHKNKMSQSICHWYYADEPEGMLFNVYNGFGAYGKGGEYSHGFGATMDPNDDTYDESLDNTIWCGVPYINSDQTTANVLDAPWDFVNRGYFKDASGFINGLKFPYDESSAGYNPNSNRNAPSSVYLMTATTPREFGRYAYWTAQSNVLGLLRTVAIITDRVSDSTAVKDLPKTQRDEMAGKDRQRDWHNHSDMDNRFVVRRKDRPAARAYYDPTGEYMLPGTYIWLDDVASSASVDTVKTDLAKTISGKDWDAVKNPTHNGNVTKSMLMRIGGYGEYDTSYRNEDNANGLFITYLRTPIKGTEVESRKNDPLFVIFETKRSDNLTNVAKNIVYKKSDPSAITLGGVRNALHDYWVKYSPMIEIINKIVADGGSNIIPPTNLPDMDDLKVIVDIMTNIEMPEVLYFHNSIISRQDITLSTSAHEINYFKTDDANEYVWRYSGSIKPAIYPITTEGNIPRIQRGTGFELTYTGWYGRNFLWYKEPLFAWGQTIPTQLAKYINRNIAPKYPSLDFDVVNPLIINDNRRPTRHGDMMYDEIPPIYFGMLVDALGNIIDRNSFTPADFEFERANIDSPFSFANHVLDRPLTDFGGTNYYKNTEYNALARKAVKEGIFNLDNLRNRNNNHIAYWLYADEYSSYEWAEFKWFNRSYAMMLPEEVIMTTGHPGIDTNDKEHIEEYFLDELLKYIRKNSKYPHLYDKALLRANYDFNYDLQKIEPNGNKPLLYKYNVTATLK